MANVNDTNNTTGKLENQWENLRNADIDDKDREAIEKFVRLERRGNQNRKPNTLISDLSTLRTASKRSAVPLVEMDMSDVQTLLIELTTPKDQGATGSIPTARGSKATSGFSGFSSDGSITIATMGSSSSPKRSNFPLTASNGSTENRSSTKRISRRSNRLPTTHATKH